MRAIDERLDVADVRTRQKLMAFGAGRKAVLTMVLRDGLRLVAIGVALSAAGAAALSTVLSSLVPDIGRIDLVSFAIAIAVLLAVAALACHLPARRASRLDPLIVMRGE